MKRIFSRAALAGLAVAGLAAVGAVSFLASAPAAGPAFGLAEDVTYAGALWRAMEAARLRFRPLLMTTISFVFGTLPLLVATGAGASSRQAVGTAVFGGMVAATFLTVTFVPLFFQVFQGLGERLLGEKLGVRGTESAPGAAEETANS